MQKKYHAKCEDAASSRQATTKVQASSKQHPYTQSIKKQMIDRGIAHCSSWPAGRPLSPLVPSLNITLSLCRRARFALFVGHAFQSQRGGFLLNYKVSLGIYWELLSRRWHLEQGRISRLDLDEVCCLPFPKFLQPR